ncbi:MAG TPA: hypothetical protein VJA27_00610 [Patescibacteria group bacterium]|nr:hypothetical protein [Patescibacteria group bacterium]
MRLSIIATLCIFLAACEGGLQRDPFVDTTDLAVAPDIATLPDLGASPDIYFYREECEWKGAGQLCENNMPCSAGMRCIRIVGEMRCNPLSPATFVNADGGTGCTIGGDPATQCGGRTCECYKDSHGTYPACSVVSP